MGLTPTSLAIFSFTLIFALAPRVYAEDPDDNYYYFGEQKIVLTPNPNSALFKELTPGIVSKFSALAANTQRLGEGRFYAGLNANKTTVNKLEALNLVQDYPTYLSRGQEVAVTGDIIVTFKPNVTSNDAKQLLRLFGNDISVRETEPNSYHLRILNSKSTLSVANTLDRNKDVLYAQPNFLHIVTNLRASKRPKVMAALAAPTFPSDSYFPQQWGLENNNTNPDNGKHGADIKIRDAWNITHGSPDIVVAVIDEGIDATHPDLQGKIIQVLDTFPGGDGRPAPGDNHGTNCAGVIGAVVDNGIGIAGIAPNARLISIRVIRTQDGVQESSSDTIAKGIGMAIDRGAHIISMSLILTQPEPVVQKQIERALVSGVRGNKGTIMIFPSGDSGADVSYPANLSLSLPVIAVGASNEFDEVKTRNSKDHDEVSWSSNTGKELTLVAPGVHICTTDLVTPDPVPYVCDFRGTSAAVPFVAGIAALLISKNPGLSAAQVRDQLTSTADKLGPSAFDPSYGFGRVNACRALSGTTC